MTLPEGVRSIRAEIYHADPAPQPSLSSGIARVLIAQSPRHAWTQHPRLNPSFEPEDRQDFDLGSAAHRVMLGAGKDLCIIDADSYRTKAAQEARDAARAKGLIPVLPHQDQQILAMTDAARVQLAAHHEARDAFTNGTAEQTLIWREGDVWCRAMLDWLPINRVFFDDYKTTTDASPDACVRRIFDSGYDIQAAFYRRGIRKVLAVENPRFRFIFQEREAPFAVTVAALTPAALDMAERKVEAAIDLWRWCMKNQMWPGYPARTVYVDPPVWHEKQWLEREEREMADTQAGRDVKADMLAWQAPV